MQQVSCIKKTEDDNWDAKWKKFDISTSQAVKFMLIFFSREGTLSKSMSSNHEKMRIEKEAKLEIEEDGEQSIKEINSME